MKSDYLFTKVSFKKVQEQIKAVKAKIVEATEAKEAFSFADWGGGPSFSDYSNLHNLEEQAKQIQDNIKKINEKKQGNAVATGVKKNFD